MAKIQKKSKQQFHLIPFFLFSTQRLSIRGGQLSPLGFAACQSKKCTNRAKVPQHYNPPTDCTEFTEISGGEYSPTDCTDFHRLGGYGIPAIPTQPPNYPPTEFTEHTETTGGEEKSVYICEIRGRLLPARRFCGFCVFRGRFLSEAMLVQRRPLHLLKIAMLQQQDCHATTTMLPRYNNKIATLRQQGCHATAKYRETDVR